MEFQGRADFVHTGPGTIGGRFLRRYWQPLYRAEDLPAGRAVPARIMGEDLTLFRGESGTPHAVEFRCAHRGTQLSVGWVENDAIRCRYHGWKYEGSGQCIEAPGTDDAFASRIRVRSYPTAEYLGLVFCYLGEGDAPPLRRFPDMEQRGALDADAPEIWPCNFFNRLDNDTSHVPWTHHESARRMGQMRGTSDPYRYTETAWGVSASADGRSNNHFVMPNVNQLKVQHRVPGYEGRWEHRLVFHVPIDDETSAAFDVNLTPLATDDEIERYRAIRRSLMDSDTDSPYDTAEAIIAGRMRVEDMDTRLPFYKQFWIEDYVTQVGQGRIANRATEHLAPTDVQPTLKRSLWERELRKLAAGEPLKDWTTPSTVGLGAAR